MLDVRSLPYAPGSFDAVVAIQVIEYLDDPKQALSALRRVAVQFNLASASRNGLRPSVS